MTNPSQIDVKIGQGETRSAEEYGGGHYDGIFRDKPMHGCSHTYMYGFFGYSRSCSRR